MAQYRINFVTTPFKAKSVKTIHNLAFRVHSVSLWLIGCVLVFSGCIEPWEGPPHFLHIEDITFVPEVNQGEATSRIEEVWVYSETDVLGAFPLPADIPLSPSELGESTTLTLTAGIRANAISSTRKPYPFYDAVDLPLALEFGGKDTLEMAVGYTDGTEVVIAEDFETANRFEPSVTSTAEIVRTQSEQLVLNGTSSGLIVLDEVNQVLISSTNEQQYNLHSNGPVWLELDYACTQPFWVGLYVKDAVNALRIPILLLNSTEGERNKIYLDLDPIVRTTPDATHYEITLDAYYDGSADSTTVIVDNFKLLRYP
ncbi:MAG: hypothetical protein CL828_05650 [Crocinitomicaceae bacterium]|nr:hypothetical protein [Crocinitomicaceae bacterium]